MLNLALIAILAILAWYITSSLDKWHIQPIRQVFVKNMAVVSGEDFRLSLDVAGGTSWSVLGQEQGTTIAFTVDKADATNKDSTNWEESVSTIRHVAISSNGVLDETDPAWVKLLAAFFDTDHPLQIEAKITTPASITYIGQCNIDSLEYDGPHDGVMTFSVSLSGNGAFAVGP